MLLSQQIQTEAQPLLKANEEHPFVQGIINGSLTKEQLAYYDQQDISFEYNEVAVLNALITYSTTTAQTKLFEKRLHMQLTMLEDWLAREADYDIPHSWQGLKQAPIQPINQMYQQHMAATINTHSVLQILPSFAAGEWVYIELGKYMRTQDRVTTEPFSSFLALGNKDFLGPNGYIQQFFNIIDDEAKGASEREQQTAKQTFLKSCILEWYFWESAYQRSTWNDWQETALSNN
ncbi:TenA family protein [Secundilactobacillus yichangensis]|uniref:TenA family protein n=1 Tax=Secundilactobacillus yichangensis TaxID=2799580 RepID=UPI001940439D|nr:TenA family protein [Secundilactobacillus yichangensis]